MMSDDGGFPGESGKVPVCQCRRHKRHRFGPWVGNIPWRRKWQPTPVFLPGKSHGQTSLEGYISWGGERVRRDLAKQQHNNNDRFSGKRTLEERRKE